MNTSENAQEFDNIIEADRSDNWQPAQLSPAVESKLLPLLATIPSDQPGRPGFSLSRLWEPHFKFWNRYVDSWKNGNSTKVLVKYTEKLASEYPVVFLQKCLDKFSGWLSK